MKRLFILFLFVFSGSISHAQNPSYQQKLYYTIKVWGFVKYYHSSVSNCQLDWDSVLVRYLPSIKNSVTENEFNEVLDSILLAAGPMSIDTTPFPDTLAVELKRNRDWTWINDSIFRPDVKAILDTIKNNFRPHAVCWVEDNIPYNPNYGWLIFPEDDTILRVNTISNFPNEWNRILALSKYWNIIRYFNPYNYVLDNPCDSTLNNSVLNFAVASDSLEFYLAFRELVSALDDAHAEGISWSSTIQYPYDFMYHPMVRLKYTQGKYVVVKSASPTIHKGDAVVSVEGISPIVWEDSLRHYISAGDSSVFRRTVCKSMLGGEINTQVTIVLQDSTGNNYTRNIPRTTIYNDPFFESYYPNDTLAGAKWKKWDCNVGYANMGNLLFSDINPMYSALQNTSSIIFDIRNAPNGTAWAIADLMLPQRTVFAKALIPDVNYPGTYYWYTDSVGNTNSTSYSGKIILLMNEETQSHAEYSCMIFESMPDVVKVGSQTAGADGNITYFKLSHDIGAGFTSIGIFYPNGDSTQRIGIVPDSVIYPTQNGIRHGRDELLEKALEIAQCWTSVTEANKGLENLYVFPNPTESNVYIRVNGLVAEKANITICDFTGKAVFNKTVDVVNGSLAAEINLDELASGIYLLRFQNGDSFYTEKIIRE